MKPCGRQHLEIHKPQAEVQPCGRQHLEVHKPQVGASLGGNI